MKKGFRALLVVALLAAVTVGALRWKLSGLEHERVSGDVHMLQGLGGNVAVLATSEGAVVVDTMTFAFQGEAIRELAEELGGGPVQAILNTHYHLDHSHGNPGFDGAPKVVATERTLHHMLTRDADFWEGDGRKLPNTTFETRHEMNIGGKTIRAIYPGRGHTDGDLVVLFVEDRVLHAGDLFFNKRYPNIDLEAGGSVREWAATLDRVLELDFDRVIPGHGEATDRAGLRAFRDFMAELWEQGQRAAAAGWTLKKTLAMTRLELDQGYDTMEIPLLLKLDRDFVVSRAWQEASGAVTADP
jgi:glyoxylase-like metal-dependent hydrolase (beta-lactamase superfamily II)